jgi:hypothetical protein
MRGHRSPSGPRLCFKDSPPAKEPSPGTSLPFAAPTVSRMLDHSTHCPVEAVSDDVEQGKTNKSAPKPLEPRNKPVVLKLPAPLPPMGVPIPLPFHRKSASSR